MAFSDLRCSICRLPAAMGLQPAGEQLQMTTLHLQSVGMPCLVGSGGSRTLIRKAMTATVPAGPRAAHPAEDGQTSTLMRMRRVTTAGKIQAGQRRGPGESWRETSQRICMRSMLLRLLADEATLRHLLRFSAMRIMSLSLQREEGALQRFRLRAPAHPRGRGVLKLRRIF
jgi:hypothetical protein